MLIAVALTMTGCGSIDWLPAYKRLPTTPDQFSFADKTGVPQSASVTSDPVTVSGLTADSPIGVTGSVGSNSQYSIDGAQATSAAGSVKNGDTVTVTQTSASTLGTATVSTLTIGNISAGFTSITQTVGSFSITATSASLNSGPIPLSLVSGLHTVSIVNGSYSFNNSEYTTLTQTISLSNAQTIWLLNPGFGNKVTTLTIDSVPSTFTIL